MIIFKDSITRVKNYYNSKLKANIKPCFLLRNWKILVCDYWHYKQTEHFIREHWHCEMNVLNDIEILLKASETELIFYK
jgi:hypothetical protein